MSLYNPLPIFYDAECLKPVRFRSVGDSVEYEFKFPPIFNRKVSFTSFYVKNASMGNVEDLSVEVGSPDVVGVKITLDSPESLNLLGVGEVYEGRLRCESAEGVLAGPVSVGISAVATITRERK